jgi:hypothetical protein
MDSLTERQARAMALGEELLSAIDRGRRLHPWENMFLQIEAIRSEARELVDELDAELPCRLSVYGEAVDVFVCAYRAKEGR